MGKTDWLGEGFGVSRKARDQRTSPQIPGNNPPKESRQDLTDRVIQAREKEKCSAVGSAVENLFQCECPTCGAHVPAKVDGVNAWVADHTDEFTDSECVGSGARFSSIHVTKAPETAHAS